MNNGLKIFLGSILALLMGVGVASPLLILNLGTISPIPTGIKPEIQVDVVYAYFDILSTNQNITGLWRNYSTPAEDPPIVEYLFVLNLTNYSNYTVEIPVLGVKAQTGFDLYYYPDPIPENQSILPTILPNYSILSEYRYFDDSFNLVTFDNTMKPKQSRLIGLSGIQTVRSIKAFEAMKTGKIVLIAQTGAMINGSSRNSSGIVDNVKQVQFEIFENEYLYNILVLENQRMKISNANEMDVTIESRS